MKCFLELRSRILSGIPSEVISALNEASAQKIHGVVPEIRELLRMTEHHGIRDVCALTLREIGDPDVVTDLISLLKDPRTDMHRGALVYALEPFARVELLPFLIDLVISDNLEVQNVATLVIEAIDGIMTDEMWNSCCEKLNTAIRMSEDPDRVKILQYILSLFEDSPENDTK